MQYWQESDETPRHIADDSIVDLSFRIKCKTLPVDHAYHLSQAICAELDWIEQEPRAGIHLIHGAESGNGWQRPADTTQDILQLSKRTRLTLRLPKESVSDAQSLSGKELGIDGHALAVGAATVKPLNNFDTIFARYVVTNEQLDEDQFSARVAAELEKMGVQIRKLLCGRTLQFQTSGQPVFVKSVMLADLEAHESLRIQQTGLGTHRIMGCGLFVPHKGIRPVHQLVDDDV
ncbi:MAG: type I-MYXAN CRISPR-associated protein Cas6/Cmx6 [Gammaproteobacteria bacterium]|nr:type I-MYXAN CRISPR-associated protein Cas6/Cmx6 [Gammaproteobacteria bacterium]